MTYSPRDWLSWLDADQAWHQELVKHYGPRAGGARYDARGVATPRLRELHDHLAQERTRFFAHIDAKRAAKKGRQA